MQSTPPFCSCRLLVSGVQCDVRKLPHAVVRRTLLRGKCRDSCGQGCTDWSARRYSFSAGQWVLRLSCRRHKLSRVIVLLHENSLRILPNRHKPWCVSNSIGTSSSFHRIVRTWHRWTFSCFQKWRSTLLVNVQQMMKTWRMLSAATWYEEGIHKLVPRYKCLNVKGDFVEKETKVCAKTCIFSFRIIIKNILVWQKGSLLYRRPS